MIGLITVSTGWSFGEGFSVVGGVVLPWEVPGLGFLHIPGITEVQVGYHLWRGDDGDVSRKFLAGALYQNNYSRLLSLYGRVEWADRPVSLAGGRSDWRAAFGFSVLPKLHDVWFLDPVVNALRIRVGVTRDLSELGNFFQVVSLDLCKSG